MGRERDGMTEEWAPCPGHDLYDVSDAGQVRSWNNNRWGRRQSPKILRQRVNPDGYCFVNLGRGVVKTVHSLVCETFHGPRPTGKEAAHGNGIPTDNRAENLRWATPTQNCQDQLRHGTRHVGERKSGAKLTDANVLEIRRLRAQGVQNNEIAVAMGIAASTCSSAALGRKWKHLPGGHHGA